MDVFSTILFYAGPVIVLATFLAALSWRRRKGKALLCAFLLLWLLAGVAFPIAVFLNDRGIVELSDTMWNGVTLMTSLGDLASSVLLLCFAIVMRNVVSIDRS